MKRFFSNISAIYADQAGAVAYLVGLLITASVLMTGIAVDLGRLYAAQSAAQRSIDAATLGAVITAGQTNVGQEFSELFNVNYSSNYMGSNIVSLNISESSSNSGIYNASATVAVPRTITSMLGGGDMVFTVNSQITRGYEVETQKKLELALVLDNTGSMVNDINALKKAARNLVDIVFGGVSNYRQNLLISVLPYDVGVNIGMARIGWIQPYFRTRDMSGFPQWQRPAFYGVASNRNWDIPRTTHIDTTDEPPTTEMLRFRSPWHYKWDRHCSDFSSTALEPMLFASHSKDDVRETINGMRAVGCTRVNVGALWGWMALSPRWQGYWDPNRTNLPQDFSEDLVKAMVLMTDGYNSVFNNDNASLLSICAAMRAQGITIYTVGYGSSLQPQLLKDCAADPSRYFHAPTRRELEEVFEAIGDDIVYSTIRISQ